MSRAPESNPYSIIVLGLVGMMIYPAFKIWRWINRPKPILDRLWSQIIHRG